MQTEINRRNFRQEYNLLRLECEEVRQQNRRLKDELLKLMQIFEKRPGITNLETRVTYSA